MELTAYQKNKDAIHRWRNKNKETYLIGLSVYFYKKMQDPEQRIKQYKKLNNVNFKKKLKTEL